MDSQEKELREKIRPIMENMVFQLVCEKPESPVQLLIKLLINFNLKAMFMINWLQKQGGYTSNGLTLEEKSELERLRLDIRKYRDLDAENTNEDSKSQKSMESDDEETVPDHHVDTQVSKAKARLSNPRSGVSAEVYGNFNKKEDFNPRVIKKSEEQIHRIKARILQSFLFCNLEQKDLEIVINAMEEKTYEPEQTVIEQGEAGDCLFVVETGELNCYKKFTKDGESKLVKNYGPGDAFGELALLYNSPRAATVKAKTSCTLWTVDRECFNHIVKEAAQKKRSRYEAFLKSVEILSTIEPYELLQISDALKSSTFNKGDYVIKEGEFGDVFYIIEEGEAVATKTHEPGKPADVVKSYSKGEYFGELALIKGEPRAANIVATSTLKLVSIDRDSFKRLFGPIEEILKRNSDKYVKFIK